MKKILLIAFSVSMLCMAAAEMTAGVSKKEVATETTLDIAQEAAQVMMEEKEEPAIVPEESTVQPIAAQSKPAESKPAESKVEVNTTAQIQASEPAEEAIPSETIHATTGDPVPTAVEHAKTGYDGEEETTVVEAAPTVTESADADTAIRAAQEFAVNTYGLIIDSSLNFDNSSYRFPAVVPTTVSQETLNAKAIDMVDYTFQQQIALCQVTAEQIRNAGIHCNIVITEQNSEWFTYVFYDG